MLFFCIVSCVKSLVRDFRSVTCSKHLSAVRPIARNIVMCSSKGEMRKSAEGFLKFVDASPSPYHVVEECRSRLLLAGFKELSERDHWTLSKNSKYFVTRNQSTIIAFAVGGSFQAGNGFSIIGAHTDSPCLRVKVKSSRVKCGFVQVGVETYGGGIWGTWFDRDLKFAGRVLVSEKQDGEKIKHKLVHVNRPILRIPHLAIHLQREMNDKFSINKETHLVPIIATQAEYELNKAGGDNDASDNAEGSMCCKHKHHPVVTQLLATDMKIDPGDIVDVDLCLADCQPAAIGGVYDELIFSPRLDNLMSSYTALQALISSCNDAESLKSDPNVRMICLFDNEEVGSASAQGAGSAITEFIMRRIANSADNATAFEESIPKSFMISADMAHAHHPNYPGKHEENLCPSLHGGPVIKINNNQKYATTAITATVVREAARLANISVQDVMVRNDSPCGSTIGPILSEKLGLRTCDMGGAQLSMHSCREMCGVSTVLQCERLFESFFKNFPKIDGNLTVE